MCLGLWLAAKATLGQTYSPIRSPGHSQGYNGTKMAATILMRLGQLPDPPWENGTFVLLPSVKLQRPKCVSFWASGELGVCAHYWVGRAQETCAGLRSLGGTIGFGSRASPGPNSPLKLPSHNLLLPPLCLPLPPKLALPVDRDIHHPHQAAVFSEALCQLVLHQHRYWDASASIKMPYNTFVTPGASSISVLSALFTIEWGP